MSRVAINGFGRIGRAVFKILMDTPGLELAAINDLVPVDNLVYMLRYDSVYGRYDKEVKAGPEGIIINGKEIRVFAEKDPEKLPWREMKIDLVFECTGRFTDKEGLLKHIAAGAANVILSTTSKSADIGTIIHGVNKPDEEAHLISCASCTTNCITPVIEILGRRLGIKKAIMTTVHAYTASQGLVDSPNKKLERGRAGAENIVPTTTGAAIATTRVLPEYTGRFDGLALRVPVPVGSISDITLLVERPTTKEEVISIFKEETGTERYKKVLGVSNDPIVSSDIIKDSRASVIDAGMTQVVDGDLVKVVAWYDNEWGYSNQMVREAIEMLKMQTVGV
jgi:glyceraldehyde 3-phosphate dehydrogenase